MPEVHQHPDGQVFVRTPGVTYVDTLENLERDFGVTVPPMPDGADDRIYRQSIRHAIMSSEEGNLIAGGEIPWPFGDDLIARVQEGLAAQQRRAEEETQAVAMARSAEPVPVNPLNQRLDEIEARLSALENK